MQESEEDDNEDLDVLVNEVFEFQTDLYESEL